MAVFLEHEDVKVDQEQEDNFEVDDDHKANWALKKIRQLNKKKQKNEEFAEKEINEIKKWLDQENSKLEDSIEYFESLLTEYAMKLKEQDEDLKTKNLPAGKIQFRKQQPKWNYDNKELLESVKSAGLNDLVKVKERVDKRKLKNQVEVAGDKVINTKTGEVIDGVEVKERGEKFKIKVNS